ncbi:MAG: hypothetical protein WD468_01415 [Pirellulales bacterium]
MIGCGEQRGLDTAAVSGTVTLDGKPYTQGGSILFQPRPRGKMATGRIQDNGTFELSTYSEGDGAVVGEHKVAIMPPSPEVVDENNPAPPPKSPIPKKYRSPATSGLTFEVLDNQANEFSIELQDK